MLPRLCEYWVKNCVLLPAVGKQHATFSPNFTQPGAHLLVHPCTIPLLFIWMQGWRQGVLHLLFRPGVLLPEVESRAAWGVQEGKVRAFFCYGYIQFSLPQFLVLAIIIKISQGGEKGATEDHKTLEENEGRRYRWAAENSEHARIIPNQDWGQGVPNYRRNGRQGMQFSRYNAIYVFLNSSFLKVLNDRNKNRKDKKMDVIITRQEVLQFLAAINMTGANIDREVWLFHPLDMRSLQMVNLNYFSRVPKLS